MFATLVAATSNTDSGGILLFYAAGPVAGFVFYGWRWRHYRNDNKSHNFEHETRIGAQHPTGADSYYGTNNGTRASRISAANGSDHRQRVKRLE